jgi:hypothetical protein
VFCDDLSSLPNDGEAVQLAMYHVSIFMGDVSVTMASLQRHDELSAQTIAELQTFE